MKQSVAVFVLFSVLAVLFSACGTLLPSFREGDSVSPVTGVHLMLYTEPDRISSRAYRCTVYDSQTATVDVVTTHGQEGFAYKITIDGCSGWLDLGDETFLEIVNP